MSTYGCARQCFKRGYLLNLRVKFTSAEIPVWRCSHIRQLTGATLTAESPDVNVLNEAAVRPLTNLGG